MSAEPEALRRIVAEAKATLADNPGHGLKLFRADAELVLSALEERALSIKERSAQRLGWLICGGNRTGDGPVPYNPDEQRVVDYIIQNTPAGGGDDPIGWLIASHAYLVALKSASPSEPKP